jgi:methylmalonyl-CoA mutase cobalamin-binding subunit
MKPNFLPCLVLACIFAGCSKHDETSTPPATQPAASNTPAAVPQVVSAPTNPAPTAVQNALDTVGQTVKTLPGTTTPTAPANAASPSAATTIPLSLASLSSDQVTQGLKEALGKGLEKAVGSLGQPGGFLTNLDVKIPMPDKLQTVEKTLRSLGQGALADEFVTTMNQAAEQAVPAAADVFTGSLKQMTVADAKQILSGPDDAATQYFRKTTGTELTQKFLPIIQQATAKSGATAAYKQIMDKARIASPFMNTSSFDLDAYVTDKATDGLFKMVAAEEKQIRENPVARSTDLLKSVFGALQK